MRSPLALRLVLGAAMAAALPAAPGIAQGQPSIPALGGIANAPAPVAGENGTVALSAVFAGEPRAIRSGLVWRVFEDRADATPPVPLVRSDAPTPSFTLAPGAYMIHATYGFASASKRVLVQPGSTTERLTISAGALKLGGAIGDTPIPPSRLSFSVFVPVGTNSEGRLVRGDVKAGDLVRLPEGTYHVVSTYGDSNAIMRADLKVDNGRVTEATLNHRAATVTLKLVASPGGEAFAGTAFSVLTPGGDVIREAIGAFPAVTLAEGEYSLIARHEGEVFTREFKVESGLDRDIEVLAKKDK
jgi:hypothetical protein